MPVTRRSLSPVPRAAAPAAASSSTQPRGSGAPAPPASTAARGKRQRLGPRDEDDDDYDQDSESDEASSGSDSGDDDEESDADESGAHTQPAPVAASAGAATSSQPALPDVVLALNKKQLQERIQAANDARTDGLKWKKTLNVPELRIIVARIVAGDAPPSRRRARAGRRATRATATSATGELSRCAEVFIVPTAVRAVYEHDALQQFAAPHARAALNDFVRRVDAVPGTVDVSDAQAAAAILEEIATPLLDGVMRPAMNANLNAKNLSLASSVEMRSLLSTTFLLAQFNGSLSRRFACAYTQWPLGGSIKLLEEARFRELADSMSLIKLGDTSLGSDDVHPSRNAEAFGPADVAFFEGMKSLVAGLVAGTYVIDDDVNKGKAVMAKILADVQVTDRKGEAVTTDAVVWSTGGVPLMSRYLKPGSTSDATYSRVEQFTQMLRELVNSRAERGMDIVADRGYMSMVLVHGFLSALNVSMWGPLRDKARAGVPIVRVATNAAAPTATPAASAGAAGAPAASTSTTTATSTTATTSVAITTTTTAAPAAATTTTDMSDALSAPLAVLPRGMHRLTATVPAGSVSRLASTGPEGQVRLVRTDEMGDGTYAAGRLVSGRFVGVALSTEHGTRNSKTNFTTPIGVSMDVKRIAELSQTFVLVRKPGVRFKGSLFVPADCSEAPEGNLLALRDALLVPCAARPLTTTDCTLDWFGFRMLSPSGTGMVGAYSAIVDAVRRLQEDTAMGVAPEGTPAPALLDQLLVLLRAAEGELPEAAQDAVVEE